MAAEIQQVYGLSYTGKEQRPKSVLVRLLVPQYDNGITADGVGNEPQLDGTFKSIEIYRRDGGSNNLHPDFTSFYPNPSMGRTMYSIKEGAVQEAFENNINVCTHEDAHDACACAYFIITNLTGNLISAKSDGNGGMVETELKVYFNIAQLDLNGKKFTVEQQVFKDNADNYLTIYTGNVITPIPDSVTITVTGVPHWILQGGTYVQTTQKLTFNIYRDGFSPADISAYCGVFTDSFVYGTERKNIDVSYDQDGNPQSAAEITIALKEGSIIATGGTTITTNFTIYPRDIT
ncbi:MAG: hypothetical protein J6R35_02185, partial [Clostridia bacterium]|nr:hypothetical protein [Clostridia bacterium]